MYMDNKPEKELDGKPERRVGDAVHILIEKLREESIPFEVWVDDVDYNTRVTEWDEDYDMSRKAHLLLIDAIAYVLLKSLPARISWSAILR